jgi:hypothetical protein
LPLPTALSVSPDAPPIQAAAPSSPEPPDSFTKPAARCETFSCSPVTGQLTTERYIDGDTDVQRKLVAMI